MRSFVRRLAPAAISIGALLIPASAGATSSPGVIKAVRDNGAVFLEGLQEPSGGFETDWVLGALAAAGDPAATVQGQGISQSARSYYQSLVGNPASWPGSSPTVADYDRAALNAYAAGIDPARVSVSQNLIARIASYYDPANPGYYGPTSNFTGTVFSALALAETRTDMGKIRVPQVLLDQSITALQANQHSDGGWTYEGGAGEPQQLAAPAEPDETGAVLAALCSAGVPTTNTAVANGLHYLEGDLVDATGAFEAPFGANTDSNAWAVQGLNACGVNPQEPAFTTALGKTPIDFLISQQLSDGGFLYEPGEAAANEYSTQDAVRALSGAGFTSPPPSAKGQPRWLLAKGFQSGALSQVTLVIDAGSAALKVCAVTLAPTSAKSTLEAVLSAAEDGAQPSGCVTGFDVSGGDVTQVNGSPSPAAAEWQVSIDGGGEALAKANKKIQLGNTIYLRLA